VLVLAPSAASAYVTGSLQVTGVTATTYASTVMFDARVDHQCPDPGPYGPPYCGFFAIVTTVPAGAACSEVTTRWVGPISEAIGLAAYSGSYSEYAQTAGTACLYGYEGGVYHLLASASYAVPGGAVGTPVTYPGNPKPAPAPPSTPPPVAPPTTPATPDFAAGLSSDPIPSWMAPRRRYVRFAISTRSVPSDVHVERFKAIVRRASGRWGLRANGETTRAVRNYDGFNQVGFSWSLPRRTLGVQTDGYLERRVRVCTRRSFSGRCVRTRIRVVSRRLIDRDLAINAEKPWQQGPAYPSRAEYDLESVVIHEFGHLAGNRHSAMCRNNPMVPALGTGEWWRSPADYDFAQCGISARVSAIRSLGPGHIDHVSRTVRTPIGPGVSAVERAHRTARAAVDGS
jgi:hypothetical protein